MIIDFDIWEMYCEQITRDAKRASGQQKMEEKFM